MKGNAARIGTNLLILLAALLVVSTSLLYGDASAQQEGGYTFPQTGHRVEGRFWEVWRGGRTFDDSLFINGLPITGLRNEVSPTDGKMYETQWFERARFEAHPENQPPGDVLLGLLGVAASRGRQDAAFKPVANPGGGMQWFEQTGHTLGDSSEAGQAIARAWAGLGGLAQFGYPISQPFNEVSKDDGKTYVVQYFERQRFEYHPEHKGTRFEVLLGRLGAEQEGKTNPTPTSAVAPTATYSPTPISTPTVIPTATPNIAALCEDIPAAKGLDINPRCGPPGTEFAIVLPKVPNVGQVIAHWYIDEILVYDDEIDTGADYAAYRHVDHAIGVHHVRVEVYSYYENRVVHGYYRVHP
ncbi:MAG TPA: hypothetical protein VEW94_02240 [Chloroflexia bacterium]|nr:hypothetical protein [Chloroflexia bacterium]